MAFGLSFGAKKQSSTTNTTLDKDVLTNTAQTQGTQSAQTQTGSTSSTGTQSQTGTSLNTGTQSGSTKGQQSQSGTTTTLDQSVSTALADRVKQILGGGITDSSIADLSNAIAGRTNSFNASQFVADTVTAAKTAGEAELQESNSKYQSAIGGSAATNSMAALLAQRGTNDLNASLAGIRANATAQAEDIANKNLTTAAGVQGQLADIAAGLTGQLKGATTTTDMTTLTDELSKILNTQAGSTAQQTQTSEQQTSQMTQLLNQLQTLLGASSESTNLTSTEKVKGKSSGGGASLAI